MVNNLGSQIGARQEGDFVSQTGDGAMFLPLLGVGGEMQYALDLFCYCL